MATTIKLKNSVTTTNTPTSLVQGEVAINITDKKVWVGNAATTPIQLLGDGASLNFTSLSLSGNLTFTGTGNRILGDFSNATIANRVAFQTSTTNGNTGIGIIPNGTSTTSGIRPYNNSDPTNAGALDLAATATDMRISSAITGTGTYVPLTFYTGGSERLRIDTSGNVGIGVTPNNNKLVVKGAHSSGRSIMAVQTDQSATGSPVFVAFYNSSDTRIGYVGCQTATDMQLWAAENVPMLFGTNNTERMRITSGGDVLVGTTTDSVTTQQGIVLKPAEGYLANNSTTSGGISLILLYSSFSTADQTKFEVTSEGNVKSRTNSYAGFSDERLKQNITPAKSQWNDIKNIEVVKFQMKSEQFTDDVNPYMLGVIAQQVEKVSPNLVEEDIKDGMKTVKYSILYMKAVKALQEAMERIETLEAKVLALESK